MTEDPPATEPTDRAAQEAAASEEDCPGVANEASVESGEPLVDTTCEAPPLDGDGGTNATVDASGTAAGERGSSAADVVVDVAGEAVGGKEDVPGAPKLALAAMTTARRGSDAGSSLGNPADASAAFVPSHDVETMTRIAKANARRNRLAGGAKSAWQAEMRDIGAMGIGLQLYFMLTKYLSVSFGVMGVLALPAIVLNLYGHGMTSKMVDPLQLAYASLGNQGVNRQIANNTLLCAPKGDVDCSWATVTTPLTSDPLRVTWILTLSDCAYSLFFALFCVFYWRRVRRAVDRHLTENLTPAKYAVCVRGLPADATEQEILEHFNARFDPTTRDQYFPLWFCCCWGRRRKVRHSRLPVAVNKSVVANLDHLEGSRRSAEGRKRYLGTWIAEVSVAHPSGGLLRAFLSMEALTQSISETKALLRTLGEHKRVSPASFSARDERLVHASRRKLDKLLERLDSATRRIKLLRDVLPAKDEASATGRAAEEQERGKLESKMQQQQQQQQRASETAARRTKAKVAAAAATAAKAARKTQRAFDWDACECAFVVFNNLESRRRCLRDYRQSSRWLARRWQPTALRFRGGTYPLEVSAAPEPSDILWENLEVTDRGRLYRRSLTTLLTLALLLGSCVVISAAQSAQQAFQRKLPPAGLCEASLPQVFHGGRALASSRGLAWDLRWDPSASCAPDRAGRPRFHVAYANGVVNALTLPRSVGPSNPSPVRCVDPCVSEASDEVCSTLPCFHYQALVVEGGQACETYQASHVLYCLCSTALARSIEQHGYVQGAVALWRGYEPCRAFLQDYSLKNAFVVAAAGVVVAVNLLLKLLIRALADVERHRSESAKMLAIALRTFGAQLLNTAVIVLLVNASLGLSDVPVARELFKGQFRDFEREWYPSVGMGITTTMLLNAVAPQLALALHMLVLAPLARCAKRRAVRTQQQMDRLYAGPDFDMAVRYPMVLTSVVVTMMFAGGSPVLLFIAALTSAATYWLDKLSLRHLYSVRTTYDEALGEVALRALPWTLAIHLGFSAWMYGNAELLQARLVDLRWAFKALGLSALLRRHPGASSAELYALLMDEAAASFDALGKHGLVAKLVRSHVLLLAALFAATVAAILLSSTLLPVAAAVASVALQAADRAARLLVLALSRVFSAAAAWLSPVSAGKKRRRALVVVPEFTDVFRKSVKRGFRPDRALGFSCQPLDQSTSEEMAAPSVVELVCAWGEDAAEVSGGRRRPGERKRTWEAMQAPVTSYAIERNGRYALAVKEVEAAWRAVRRSEGARRGKVAPVADETEPAARRLVAAAITATEPVSRLDREEEDELYGGSLASGQGAAEGGEAREDDPSSD